MYRSLWADVRISTQELPGAEDLQRLPLLDKAIVKACPAEDRLDARRREVRRIEECSSGSSGEPVTIVKGAAEQLARQWTFLRALVACGYRPGQRCLLLTSRRESRNLTLARWSYASIGERHRSLARTLRSTAAGRPVRTAFDARIAGHATARARAAPARHHRGATDAAAARGPRARVRCADRRFLRASRSSGSWPTDRRAAQLTGLPVRACCSSSCRWRTTGRRAPRRHRSRAACIAVDPLRHRRLRRARRRVARPADRRVSPAARSIASCCPVVSALAVSDRRRARARAGSRRASRSCSNPISRSTSTLEVEQGTGDGSARDRSHASSTGPSASAAVADAGWCHPARPAGDKFRPIRSAGGRAR